MANAQKRRSIRGQAEGPIGFDNAPHHNSPKAVFYTVQTKVYRQIQQRI